MSKKTLSIIEWVVFLSVMSYMPLRNIGLIDIPFNIMIVIYLIALGILIIIARYKKRKFGDGR